MPKKKPHRSIPEFPWEPTHFTREECERAVRKVFEERRLAAETRKRRRAAREKSPMPESEA